MDSLKMKLTSEKSADLDQGKSSGDTREGRDLQVENR